MTTYLPITLVLIGLTAHIATIVPLRELIAMLPAGSLRNKWMGMAGLIFIFIAGYLGYMVLLWGQPMGWYELVIAGIFLFGAIFVWLTIKLALQTAADIRQIDLLQLENVTDPLTKVYNRRYLDRRLDEEVARSIRYSLDLTILMLDIDHFKRVNDTYGHQAGDIALKALCSLVRGSLRDLDVVARYGGEEFMVICPSTDTDGAALVAERLRHLIESHPIEVVEGSGANQAIRISVSIGVASLGASLDDKKKLVQAADRALYRAKEQGRNRVIVAECGVAEPAHFYSNKCIELVGSSVDRM